MLKRFLAVLGATLAFSVCLPTNAEAQCTMKCTCVGTSCTCSSSGGAGGTCSTNGSSCIVTACKPKPQSVSFSLEGLPLSAGSDVANPFVIQGLFAFANFRSLLPDLEDQLAGHVFTGSWETVSPGVGVRKDCTGLITARYYDRRVAEAIRMRQRKIVI